MKIIRIFFALSVLFVSLPALGQIEQTRHTPNLAGNRALIREYLLGITISYVEADDGSKYFVHEDPLSSTAFAALVPDGITVNDMDIFAGYLYFCGTYTKDGNTQGIVGLFNITNLYGWGMPYYISPLDWITDETGTSVRMTRPLRVGRTVDTQPAGTHVPIVGEIEIRDAAGNITSQTGLCAAHINSLLATWKYSFYYTPNPDIVFTDITRTDNFYVAVGRHEGNRSTVIKTFNSTFPFTQSPVSSDISEVNDNKTEGDVLVTALGGEDFALVNYYHDASEAGSTVKIMDATNPINIPVCIRLLQNTSPVVSPSWLLREIQYDTFNNILFVLQDMDYPVSSSTASTVCEYKPLLSSNSGLYTQPGYSAHGMGAWTGGGFQIVGDDAGKLTYMRKVSGQNSACRETTTKNHVTYTLDANQTYNSDISTLIKSQCLTIPVITDSIKFIDDCLIK